MAYIVARGKYWRAEIRKAGHKPQYASFDTQAAAKKWARQKEAAMDAGTFVDSTLADNMTLSEALIKYRDTEIAKRGSPTQDLYRVRRWLRHDLAYRYLGSLRGVDFAVYRDERRAAGRKDNTIRLELAMISHIFTTARNEWGMEGLPMLTLTEN